MKAIFHCAVCVCLCAATLRAHEANCGWETLAAAAAPEGGNVRKYAPDREVDILHLALDVTPDWKERSVSGTATWRFKPIAKPLTELSLDGVDLTVAAVMSSEQVQSYQVAADKVVITFARSIPAGREATVSIRYSAHPRRGLYFRTPELGFKPEDAHIWTQGEPDEARHWYPCYDYPNEKFTCEVTCHVPEDIVVLSNGRKVSEEKGTNGLVAVRWLQDKPMVNYLVALVAGRLKSLEDSHRGIPMRFWTPATEITYASNSFVDTKPAMEFFEKEIGILYPWDKYDQVCIQDYHWGGMENTSLSTLNINTLFPPEYDKVRSSQGLVAHELAHQWFGDLITCKDWSHIWLNEGFATYYDLLYTEHKQGRDEFLYRLYEGAKTLLAQTNTTKSIVWRKYNRPTEQFDSFAYGKGSWVLHMLRRQLGPELFRSSVSNFVQRHQFDTVVTDDWRAVVEEQSGRSYDQFFDQWVYHSGTPVLDVDYAWDEKTRLARVSVRQAQPVNENVLLFDLPLPVRLTGTFGVTNAVFEVRGRSHDFYISLPAQPRLVRIDPDLSVLARVSFKPALSMLHAMLADTNDVVGRFIACEQLQERKDSDSVARLKKTLNSDPYWGVRVYASRALRAMQTDAAFDALLASASQDDPRARKQVVTDLVAFFRPAAFEFAQKVIETERNPDIVGVALRSLDAAGTTNARATLLRFLGTNSWREHLAETAMSTMRAADNPVYIEPLRQALARRSAELPSRTLAVGLDALAHLAREQESKVEVREFLAGFVHHPRESVRVASLNALGTLKDSSALPVLERFAGAQKSLPETTAAQRAIESIRQDRKSSTELGELRRELLELQKQNRDLRKDFDTLKSKLEAAPSAKSR